MHNINHLKLVAGTAGLNQRYTNMQNKPNFQISKLTLTLAMTNTYNNFSPLGRQKNEPKTNPNKPNLSMLKPTLTPAMAKDYNKFYSVRRQKNKPKQTQFNPPNYGVLLEC